MKPSKVPKAEPRPSVNNIIKNKTAQNGPPGITAMASATAMKAKPVPLNKFKACLKHSGFPGGNSRPIRVS